MSGSGEPATGDPPGRHRSTTAPAPSPTPRPPSLSPIYDALRDEMLLDYQPDGSGD